MQPSFNTLPAALLVSAIALPLAAATAMLVPALRRAATSLLAPVAALPALGLATLSFAGTGVMHASVTFPSLLTGFQLGLDGAGRVFLLFTSLIWLASAVYARSYLDRDTASHRFFFFFLLTMTGNLGLALAQDLVGFYLFFALMTFAAYGLVVHRDTPAARYAGRIYIMMAVLGEAMVIAGMVLAASAAEGNTAFRNIPAAVAASEHRGLISVLVLLGFGVKAGAVPLHLWLSLAHPVAPAPASAVLSGAMIKAGLLGWIRFLPLGLVSLPDWGAGIMAVGLVAAFFGVIIGLTQDDPKTVLAYSSVSQMGFMLLGIGIGLFDARAGSLALAAVLLYALHHAPAKAALFLGTGLAASTQGGRTHRMLLIAGLLLPALALAGAPLTSGAAAKIAVKAASGVADLPWSRELNGMFSLAAVGTALLMGRLFLLLAAPRKATDGRSPRPGLWLPWAMLVLSVTALVWLVPWDDARDAAAASLSPANLFGAAGPVLAGALLVAIVRRVQPDGAFGIPLRVPAGDVLVLLVRAADVAQKITARSGAVLSRWRDGALRRRIFSRPSSLSAAVSRMERILGRWIAAGIGLLLAIGGVYALLRG